MEFSNNRYEWSIDTIYRMRLEFDFGKYTDILDRIIGERLANYRKRALKKGI
jgi:hypothetical protein